MCSKFKTDTTVSPLLLAQEGSPDPPKIKQDWLAFAKALGTPQDIIDVIRVDFLCERISPQKILSTILFNWLSRKGQKGNIVTLVKAFEEQSSWLGIQVHLVNLEGSLNFECTMWNHLQRYHRCMLLSKHVQMLGEIDSLYNITKEIPEDELNKMFEQCLNGNELKAFQTSSTFDLAKNTVPSAIPYFIERKLVLRNIIDISIFLLTAINDIFAIETIDRQTLYSVSGFQPTDVSSSQVHKITCRFIVLENVEHFQQLCTQSGSPVHHIKFQMDKFIYVRSHGKSDNIKKFISNNYYTITENSFLDFLSRRLLTAVTFSSTASGDGKSTVLANVARNIQQQNKNSLVIYLNLTHFFTFPKKILLNTSKNFIKFLAVIISKNKLGAQILFHKLNNKNIQTELFIDGFDELPADKIEPAAKLISKVHTNYPNIRIFTTSTENVLTNFNHLTGHIILALDELKPREMCQLQCLYWSHFQKLDQSHNLEKFSSTCLSILHNETDDGQSVVGKPMLASVLAQLYEDHVNEISPKYIRLFTTQKISAALLYQAFLRQKLDLISDVRSKHEGLAIHQYFSCSIPDILQETNLDLSKNQEHLYKYGLAHKCLLNDQMYFVNKTYAEFLVGFYLVNSMTNYDKGNEDYIELVELFLSVLKVIKTHDMLTFNQISLCNVFNSILLECSVLQNCNVLMFAKELALHVQRTTLMACVNSQLLGIFCLIAYGISDTTFVDDLKIENKYLVKILHIASKHVNIDLAIKIHTKLQLPTKQSICKISLGIYEPFNIDWSPIHFSAQKGNFSLFKYLLDAYAKSKLPKYLLHAIVFNSKSDPAPIVDSKIQIIKYLTQIKSSSRLLKERSEYLCEPILLQNIHVDLLKFLIEAGANVYAKDTNDNTLAHIMSEYMSSEDYHYMTEVLLDLDAGAVFRALNKENQTAIEYALNTLRVKSETINLLIKSKEFISTKARHTSNGFRKSMEILRLLVKHGYSSDVIDTAREYSRLLGSEYSRTELLHAAALWQNIDVVKYILQLGANINSRNEQGLTPLHVVCTNKSIYGSDGKKSAEILKLLMEYGADLTLRDGEGREAMSYLIGKGSE